MCPSANHSPSLCLWFQKQNAVTGLLSLQIVMRCERSICVWPVDMAVTSLWENTKSHPGVHWWVGHQLALHSNPVSPSQSTPCRGLLLRVPVSCAAQALMPADLRPHMGRQQVHSQALCALCHLGTQASFPSHFTEGKLRLGSSCPIAIWW